MIRSENSLYFAYIKETCFCFLGGGGSVRKSVATVWLTIAPHEFPGISPWSCDVMGSSTNVFLD